MTFETRLDEAFGIQPTMKKTLFERKLEELDWRKAIGAAGMGLAALGGAGDAGAAPAQVAQAQELGAPVKPKTADDKANELVKPLREAYDKEVKVAQEKYNKILAVELEKATKAGSLDDVKAIKKEMEEPEGDESKWKSPAHKAAAKQFAAMREMAKKKWDLGINNLVRQLVQKKELELAEKVKNQDQNQAAISQNLAIGKPSTCSGYYKNHTAKYANDGILSIESFWGEDTQGLKESWWQVDLEEPVSVGKVVVVPYYGDGRYYGFFISGSLDGDIWEILSDKRENREPSTPKGFVCEFKVRAVRFVRVTVTSNSANTGRHLVEVMVFKK